MKSLYQECLNLGIAVDSEDAVYVFAESLLYSIGSTGAFAFQDHIRSHCKTKSPKVFRLHLREQVYSNLTIKLYLLHVVLAKPTTSHYRKLAARYNISKRDAWLIVKLLSENEWFRREVKRFVRSTPYTLLDLEQRSIDAMFTRVFPTVLKYIKHITYTKLRFLVRSTNSDFSDFHSDLSAKLVHSFYSVIPTKMSDAHLINYLRRSVHNHAINMIKMGTTQKRGRLISTEADSKGKRQFAMLCLSQNQLDLTSIGETQDVDGEDESANKFEIRFAISEVLDSMKLHSRKYRFLTLLLGSEDVEFSKYLRTQGICRDEEDNVDVQNRVAPGEYTKLVSNFLRVPKANVGVFFESLRHQLAW